jgi:lysozyme
MKYLMKFESFDSYKGETLEEHYSYIDSLILLNEGLIDEEKIKQIWNKIVDRVKGLSDSTKRKIVTYGIASLLAIGSIGAIMNVINKYQTEDVVIKDAVDQAMSNFKDPTKLKVSSHGREHIKNHEDIKLVAYTIGDGKVTVGYGHAEPIGKSKIKKGQKITPELADKFFQKDLKVAADGVRRIFNEWKEKGIEVKLTQDQFDALVSMAFNMGVGSLRQSDLIQKIKAGELEKAGNLIKTTNINDDTFPGLRDRREKEAEMFMSYLNEPNQSKG